jgi:hypothetical protein
VGVLYASVGVWMWLYLKWTGDKAITWLQARWLGLIAATSVLGAVAFFGYCQWRFGAWDLYFKTVRTGWEFQPEFSWPRFVWFFFWKGMFPVTAANAVGRFQWILVLTAAIGFFLKRNRFTPMAMALSSFAGLFSLATMVLLASGRLGGLIRYMLPSVLLLLPATLEWLDRFSTPGQRRALVVLAMILLYLQIDYITLFVRSHWVA